MNNSKILYIPPSVSSKTDTPASPQKKRRHSPRKKILKETSTSLKHLPLEPFFGCEPPKILHSRHQLIQDLVNTTLKQSFNEVKVAAIAELSGQIHELFCRGRPARLFDQRKWPDFPTLICCGGSLEGLTLDVRSLGLASALTKAIGEDRVICMERMANSSYEIIQFLKGKLDLVAKGDVDVLVILEEICRLDGVDPLWFEVLFDFMQSITASRGIRFTVLLLDLSPLVLHSSLSRLQIHVKIESVRIPRLSELVGDLLFKLICSEFPVIFGRTVIGWLQVHAANESLSLLQVHRALCYAVLVHLYGSPLGAFEALGLAVEQEQGEFYENLQHLREETGHLNNLSVPLLNALLASILETISQSLPGCSRINWLELYNGFMEESFVSSSTVLEDYFNRMRRLPFDQFIHLLQQISRAITTFSGAEAAAIQTAIKGCLDGVKRRRGKLEASDEAIQSSFINDFIDHLLRIDQRRPTVQRNPSVVFDQVEHLRAAFEVDPTELHLMGLLNPLGECGTGPIHSALLDATIMYRLLQECGRQVDTHAWYGAFTSILGGDNNSSWESLLVRFIVGLAQLEMAGLVGPLRRSRDFYERKYIYDNIPAAEEDSEEE